MTLPFYHPTSVVFVDDSTDFLLNLSLQLDTQLAFRLFSSPQLAIEWINKLSKRFTVNAEDLFSPYQYCSEDSLKTHKVIDVNFERIEKLMLDADRFEQVAVVVVDYDMPAMDGLAFCRQIKDENVKKILLTGKADESVAIKAFNQGEIDRFIVKQRNNVMVELNREIVELQHKYFAGLEKNLLSAITINSHKFLQDAAFEKVFLDICSKLGIVEYYATLEPQGILMVDQSGMLYLMLVMDDENITAQFEIAEVQDAPVEMLDILKAGKYIPYFGKTNAYYSPQYHHAWRDCLHLADEVIGDRQRYRYAVIKQPSGFDCESIQAYRDYLTQIDQLGMNALA